MDALTPEDNILIMTALLDRSPDVDSIVARTRAALQPALEHAQEAFFRPFALPRVKALSLQAALAVRGYVETLERAACDPRHVAGVGTAWRHLADTRIQLEHAHEAVLAMLVLRPSAPQPLQHVRRILVRWLEGSDDDAAARARLAQVHQQLTHAHARSMRRLLERVEPVPDRGRRSPRPSPPRTGYEEAMAVLARMRGASAWRSLPPLWPLLVTALERLYADCPHPDLRAGLALALEACAPSTSSRRRASAA